MPRTVRVVVALVLVVGAALATIIPTMATTGVSIDVARIAVKEDLLAGSEYRLPAFGVRNPGTEPTSYRLSVTYVADQETLQPPESWFEFSPGEITLDPDDSRAVQTRLLIPPDAEVGTYSALIGPEIASDEGGARIGAAAAARLSFTVVPSGPLDAWLRWLNRFVAENPWVLLVPVLLLLAGAWWFLRRRVAISVSLKG